MSDSINLYRSYCGSGRIDSNKSRLEHVATLVDCIYDEIFTEPFALKNSSFIREAVELTKNIRLSEPNYCGNYGVSLWDAYYIVKELLQRIENDSYNVLCSQDTEYLMHMFQSCTFQGLRRTEIDKMYDRLKTIKKFADSANSECEKRKNAGAANLEFEKKKTDVANTEREKKKQADGEYQGSLTSRMDYELLATCQKELTNRIEIRTRSNKTNIQNWHNSVDDFNRRLQELQPSVSSVLEKVMSFSNDLTENYILQFGRMNIDLYNLISDNYNYHVAVSEASGNKDYINAVLNYEEFQSLLVDNLAAFGIEEIVTFPGMPFERSIHEVVNNDSFSPRSAVVKKSLRSGFKYGDIVIQKERIQVEE